MAQRDDKHSMCFCCICQELNEVISHSSPSLSTLEQALSCLPSWSSIEHLFDFSGEEQAKGFGSPIWRWPSPWLRQ